MDCTVVQRAGFVTWLSRLNTPSNTHGGPTILNIWPKAPKEGQRGNHLVHLILEPLLQAYDLDGTIIEDARADEECEGPTEVVLRGSCVRYVNRVFNAPNTTR